jgi:hypothetical protein
MRTIILSTAGMRHGEATLALFEAGLLPGRLVGCATCRRAEKLPHSSRCYSCRHRNSDRAWHPCHYMLSDNMRAAAEEGALSC